MTHFNPHPTDRARRNLDHPGYGWIDAQPAVQPQTRVLEPCVLGRSKSVMAVAVQINLISTFGMKGAWEGLT